MKRCNKCNVEVNSIRKTCPLCLSVLEFDDKEYEKRYPTPKFLPTKKSLLLRILSFLSIVGIFVSVVVNIMTYDEGENLWSVIVMFNVGYFWLLVKSTFKKAGNIPVRLVVQTIAISLLVYVIDIFTGSEGSSGWALNYVIPFITMASLLSIVSLSIGNKQRYINHFPHILTAIFLGIIPTILYWIGWIVILWPALSAALFSVSTFVGMIVIGDKDTKEEIKKRFHI